MKNTKVSFIRERRRRVIKLFLPCLLFFMDWLPTFSHIWWKRVLGTRTDEPLGLNGARKKTFCTRFHSLASCLGAINGCRGWSPRSPSDAAWSGPGLRDFTPPRQSWSSSRTTVDMLKNTGPVGLVRYGVAPDHLKVKCRKNVSLVASPGKTFFFWQRGRRERRGSPRVDLVVWFFCFLRRGKYRSATGYPRRIFVWRHRQASLSSGTMVILGTNHIRSFNHQNFRSVKTSSLSGKATLLSIAAGC